MSAVPADAPLTVAALSAAMAAGRASARELAVDALARATDHRLQARIDAIPQEHPGAAVQLMLSLVDGVVDVTLYGTVGDGRVVCEERLPIPMDDPRTQVAVMLWELGQAEAALRRLVVRARDRFQARVDAMAA